MLGNSQTCFEKLSPNYSFLGLSRDTTTDSLRSYFEQFGEIKDALVKIDSQTGQSRGFGFIIFSNDASTDAVASAGNHTIDGKTVSILTYLYSSIFLLHLEFELFEKFESFSVYY